MSSDCFVCFFDTVEARDAILLGGPWVVLGQVLGIDRWTPSFSPSSSIGCCTPVWVRLPNLPFYCWSSRNIGRIMALIGEPLWLDSTKEHLERSLYVDLSKPLKSGIWVNGCHGKFFQALEYEGLSIFCCRCGHVGHRETSCIIKPSSRGIKLDNQPALAVPGDGLLQVGELVGNSIQKEYIATPCSSAPGLAHVDKPSSRDCDVVDATVDDAGCRGVGPWMMVTRKKRPNNKSAPHPAANNMAAQNFRNKVPSVPLVAAKGILHGTSLKQKSPFHYSGNASQSGNSIAPHEDANASHVLDSSLSLDVDKAESVLHSGKQFIFSGAPAQLPTGKHRPSKPFVEKLLTDLGPVSHGTRKKRKQQILPDGGDASPPKPA